MLGCAGPQMMIYVGQRIFSIADAGLTGQRVRCILKT